MGLRLHWHARGILVVVELDVHRGLGKLHWQEGSDDVDGVSSEQVQVLVGSGGSHGAGDSHFCHAGSNRDQSKVSDKHWAEASAGGLVGKSALNAGVGHSCGVNYAVGFGEGHRVNFSCISREVSSCENHFLGGEIKGEGGDLSSGLDVLEVAGEVVAHSHLIVDRHDELGLGLVGVEELIGDGLIEQVGAVLLNSR